MENKLDCCEKLKELIGKQKPFIMSYEDLLKGVLRHLKKYP